MGKTLSVQAQQWELETDGGRLDCISTYGLIGAAKRKNDFAQGLPFSRFVPSLVAVKLCREESVFPSRIGKRA